MSFFGTVFKTAISLAPLIPEVIRAISSNQSIDNASNNSLPPVTIGPIQYFFQDNQFTGLNLTDKTVNVTINQPVYSAEGLVKSYESETYDVPSHSFYKATEDFINYSGPNSKISFSQTGDTDNENVPLLRVFQVGLAALGGGIAYALKNGQFSAEYNRERGQIEIKTSIKLLKASVLFSTDEGAISSASITYNQPSQNLGVEDETVETYILKIAKNSDSNGILENVSLILDYQSSPEKALTYYSNHLVSEAPEHLKQLGK